MAREAVGANKAIRGFRGGREQKEYQRGATYGGRRRYDGARRRSKDAVRDLNQIIINKYKDNPAKLAAWKRASHTERAPRATKKEETTETSPK